MNRELFSKHFCKQKLCLLIRLPITIRMVFISLPFRRCKTSFSPIPDTQSETKENRIMDFSFVEIFEWKLQILSYIQWPFDCLLGKLVTGYPKIASTWVHTHYTISTIHILRMSFVCQENEIVFFFIWYTKHDFIEADADAGAELHLNWWNYLNESSVQSPFLLRLFDRLSAHQSPVS